jgi:hypothetical protein
VSAPAASNFPPGDLRVSDADRDRAISELTEHFQAGRITNDEFGERSALALQARTGKELAALFCDLPAPQANLTQQATPPAHPEPVLTGRMVAVGSAIVAFAVFATLVTIAFGSPQHHFVAGLAPLLVVLLVVRLLARRRFRHEHVYEHSHDHRHRHDQEQDRLR